MYNFYNNIDSHLSPLQDDSLTDEEVLIEIDQLKKDISNRVTVLGHHYQNDDIIRFADITGDSLMLAQKAATIEKPFIIFCGVHFMAETADMLTSSSQSVILPDPKAGCTMADMANRNDVEKAWRHITESTTKKIIPVTYINCSADLKAFVGEHQGCICTSSNAKKIINWALSKGDKLLFFPDQHLGRNTCFEMGIPLNKMVIYDPHQPHGGLSEKQIDSSKVILWHGYCSVHQGFNTDHIHKIKRNDPQARVIVHPECSFDVVQASDLNGSTSFIINTIEQAPPGSSFAVGTETNLVNRLANIHKNKKVLSLSPYQCICTTMYRIRPRWLLACFRNIVKNRPTNIINVQTITKNSALKALEKMLTI